MLEKFCFLEIRKASFLRKYKKLFLKQVFLGKKKEIFYGKIFSAEAGKYKKFSNLGLGLQSTISRNTRKTFFEKIEEIFLEKYF